MDSAIDCRFFEPRPLLTEYDQTTADVSSVTCTDVEALFSLPTELAKRQFTTFRPMVTCSSAICAVVSVKVAPSGFVSTVTGTFFFVMAADRYTSKPSVGVM